MIVYSLLQLLFKHMSTLNRYESYRLSIFIISGTLDLDPLRKKVTRGARVVCKKH